MVCSLTVLALLRFDGVLTSSLGFLEVWWCVHWQSWFCWGLMVCSLTVLVLLRFDGVFISSMGLCWGLMVCSWAFCWSSADAALRFDSVFTRGMDYCWGSIVCSLACWVRVEHHRFFQCWGSRVCSLASQAFSVLRFGGAFRSVAANTGFIQCWGSLLSAAWTFVEVQWCVHKQTDKNVAVRGPVAGDGSNSIMRHEVGSASREWTSSKARQNDLFQTNSLVWGNWITSLEAFGETSLALRSNVLFWVCSLCLSLSVSVCLSVCLFRY